MFVTVFGCRTPYFCARRITPKSYQQQGSYIPYNWDDLGPVSFLLRRQWVSIARRRHVVTTVQPTTQCYTTYILLSLKTVSLLCNCLNRGMHRLSLFPHCSKNASTHNTGPFIIVLVSIFQIRNVWFQDELWFGYQWVQCIHHKVLQYKKNIIKNGNCFILYVLVFNERGW